MDEFINQKKEMFRVQLAYNTLQKEITDLNGYAERRFEALETSKKELDDNRKGVMNFVNDNNKMRQEKEDHEKELIRLKAEKEDTIRRQENQIQQLTSEIDKNQETVSQMLIFKDFFRKLAKKEDVDVLD